MTGFLGRGGFSFAMPALEQVCKRLFEIALRPAMLELARPGFHSLIETWIGCLLIRYKQMINTLTKGRTGAHRLRDLFWGARRVSQSGNQPT